MPECLECEVLQKEHYINPLTFGMSYLYMGQHVYVLYSVIESTLNTCREHWCLNLNLPPVFTGGL